jgi:hypothetical protein
VTTFAARARRLAGWAGVTFGWRPADFWSATPEELATLVEAMMPEQVTPPDAMLIERMQEAYPDG